jgi:hypothetical protein
MSTRDLETIFPQGQILDIGGQRIEIRPLVLGELPAMMRAIRPFASELSAEPDWLALLAEHGEALLRALAIASHRSDDWVAALELDDAITLGAAVFEVNADFFVRRVAPKVGDLAQQIGQRLSSGSMPSPG